MLLRARAPLPRLIGREARGRFTIPRLKHGRLLPRVLSRYEVSEPGQRLLTGWSRWCPGLNRESIDLTACLTCQRHFEGHRAQCYQPLKRFAVAAIGALGLFATVVKLRRGVAPGAAKMLRHLATNKSSSVPELSSRLKFPASETVRLLDDLETRGFVQLSEDQGVGHVRSVAITKAGREQVT
jgi:IclR helix-turn-helix domain